MPIGSAIAPAAGAAGIGLGGVATGGIAAALGLPLAGLFGGNYYGQDYFSNLLNQLKQQGGPVASPGGGPLVFPPLPIPDWAKSGITDALLRAIGLGGGAKDPTTGQALSGEVMDQLISLLGAAGPAFLGSLQQQNQADWFKNTGVDILNRQRMLQDLGLNQATGIQQGFLPSMQALIEAQKGVGEYSQQDLLGALGGARNFLGQAFMSPTDLSRVPGLSDVMNFTGSAARTGADTLGALLSTLGPGSPLAGGLGMAGQFAGGQAPIFGALGNIGGQLSSAGGQTPFTGALQGVGLNTLANYGLTPQLQQTLGLGQGLLGNDPNVQRTLDTAFGILGRNPIMPLEQAISLTRNQSATDAQNRMQALKRQLLGRTGITGPQVAGGGTNELLKEFGDEALQSQSKALTDTLFGQQGLGMQMFGQGGGLLNSALQAQLGQRGLGMESILKTLGLAAGRETGIPGLTLGGGQLDLQRMLGGAGVLGDVMQGQLGGLGALQGLLGTQNQGFGTASNLLGALNQLAGTQQQNVFGLQNLGLQGSSNMYNALQGLLGLQGDTSANAFRNMFSAGAFPQQASSDWLSVLRQGMGAEPSIFGAPSQALAAPVGNFLENLSLWGGTPGKVS